MIASVDERGDDAELAAVVAERTDGNPFFAIELARLLAAEDRLDPGSAREIAAPDGVQDVLRLRLRRLPEDVRRLMGQAAVIGRSFDLELVAEVAGVDADDALDRLDRAVEAFVVVEGAARPVPVQPRPRAGDAAGLAVARPARPGARRRRLRAREAAR